MRCNYIYYETRVGMVLHVYHVLDGEHFIVLISGGTVWKSPYPIYKRIGNAIYLTCGRHSTKMNDTFFKDNKAITYGNYYVQIV